RRRAGGGGAPALARQAVGRGREPLSQRGARRRDRDRGGREGRREGEDRSREDGGRSDVMIQAETVLDVADNSGARKVLCIKVLAGRKPKHATVGDAIVASTK